MNSVFTFSRNFNTAILIQRLIMTQMKIPVLVVTSLSDLLHH